MILVIDGHSYLYEMESLCDIFFPYEKVTAVYENGHDDSLLVYTGYKEDVYKRQGLYNAQDRGRLFIGPGVEVYEGMIVGVSPKSDDITVNVCKKKQMTNTRASGSDDALKLTPHSNLSLEQCLEFIKDDELVEVTPENIRMRKRILSKELRMKKSSKK